VSKLVKFIYVKDENFIHEYEQKRVAAKGTREGPPQRVARVPVKRA
jgi:hypothetical protein